MNPDKLKNIIEAALMTFDAPRNVAQLQALFQQDEDQPDKDAVRSALDQLQEDYNGRGIELTEVASGFRFQARAEYAIWLNNLFQDKPQRYSRAFMETLAIIAYRQPITRSEIEDIRGVSVNTGIIKSLQEREWIRVVGHRDVPGKPELLATTREFLDYFNLKKLSELPPLSDIKDYDELNPDLFEGMEIEPQPGNSITEEASSSPGSDEAALEGTSNDIPEEPHDKEAELLQEDNVVPFSS